jgi:hypothetical protein
MVCLLGVIDLLLFGTLLGKVALDGHPVGEREKHPQRRRRKIVLKDEAVDQCLLGKERRYLFPTSPKLLDEVGLPLVLG